MELTARVERLTDDLLGEVYEMAANGIEQGLSLYKLADHGPLDAYLPTVESHTLADALSVVKDIAEYMRNQVRGFVPEAIIGHSDGMVEE